VFVFFIILWLSVNVTPKIFAIHRLSKQYHNLNIIRIRLGKLNVPCGSDFQIYFNMSQRMNLNKRLSLLNSVPLQRLHKC